MQIKKSDRVMFIEVEKSFYRFKKMTNKENSFNAEDEEYQYVDMATKEKEVSGYAPSTSIEFNVDNSIMAQKPIVDVFEKELLGTAAEITACEVHLDEDYTEGNAPTGAKKAFKRNYTVIPDSDSGEAGPLSYSGDLSAKAEKIWGYATTTDNWQTCTFTEEKGGTTNVD